MRRAASLPSTLALAVALSAPATMTAQRAVRCVDSIPAAAMTRVPVYAAAEVADAVPVSTAVVASVDLHTQALAEQLRALLGAAPGQLPPGDPVIGWRQLDHQLRVTAHRDGRLAWRVEAPAWLSDQSLGDEGARQLARALDTARRNGEVFVWDDALQRDSLTWIVRLEPAALAVSGTITPPRLRAGFPVFTVPSPAIEPADVERMRTSFPMVSIRGFAGTVRLQFVIDTTGRAVPSTIRGIWPPNEARLVGPPAFAYDSLVRIMRISLEAARFMPARIGRCTIAQLVQQAFTYRPAR